MFCYLQALLPDPESNRKRQTGNLLLCRPFLSFKKNRMHIHCEQKFRTNVIYYTIQSEKKITLSEKDKSVYLKY